MAETKSPGWYPAPDGDGQQWWNGAGWSETRRAVTSAPSVPRSAPPIYSATNPPPQRPDPYAAVPALQQAMPGRALDLSQNRNAVVGFVLGIVSTFFFGLLAPVGIVFSILGIAQARRLKAQGVAPTGMGFALTGLLASIVAGAIALVQLIVFLVTVFSFDVAVSSRIPGFGVLGMLVGF